MNRNGGDISKTSYPSSQSDKEINTDRHDFQLFSGALRDCLSYDMSIFPSWPLALKLPRMANPIIHGTDGPLTGLAHRAAA